MVGFVMYRDSFFSFMYMLSVHIYFSGVNLFIHMHHIHRLNVENVKH